MNKLKLNVIFVQKSLLVKVTCVWLTKTSFARSVVDVSSFCTFLVNAPTTTANWTNSTTNSSKCHLPSKSHEDLLLCQSKGFPADKTWHDDFRFYKTAVSRIHTRILAVTHDDVHISNFQSLLPEKMHFVSSFPAKKHTLLETKREFFISCLHSWFHFKTHALSWQKPAFCFSCHNTYFVSKVVLGFKWNHFSPSFCLPSFATKEKSFCCCRQFRQTFQTVLNQSSCCRVDSAKSSLEENQRLT